MPRGQPFTRLCQALARPRYSGRADLHLHTTASDGVYTPLQLLEVTRKGGFSAISITDHDITDGALQATRLRRAGDPVVIIGAEISVQWKGRELHLLAYGVNPDSTALRDGLAEIRHRRAARLVSALEQLRARGLKMPDLDLPPVPGRRHLAMHMVAHGHAATIQSAIRRWLIGGAGIRLDPVGMEIQRAVTMVREAGGFTSLAHPPEYIQSGEMGELAELGVAGVEAEYPDFSATRILHLREMAAESGLKVTGGSDCHGPGPRAPGSKSLEMTDFLKLAWEKRHWILHPEEKPCWERSGKN